MNWWIGFLGFVCAILRIKCNRPRLRPGTASMAPKVVRDRLEHLHCEKWRYHAGPCEAKRAHLDPREENENEQWQ